MMVINKAHEKF